MELLKELYAIHSPSGKEKRMRRFVKRWVRDNVPNAIVEQDSIGNVYITRGECETYPIVVAHLDQVQKFHSKDFEALVAGNIILGWSPKTRSQQGLGADDKNGIWVALKTLKHFKHVKVALFVQEEVGCIGSDKADMDFFKDARFVLQCDRRNGSDLITEAGWTELCSKQFVEAIQPELFGYKPTSGMLTDVLTLKENGLGVSCLNISCGYYEPHTDYEITVVSELMNCLDFVWHIIRTCKDVYPHEFSYYRKYYEDKYNSIYYNEDITVVPDKENESCWEEKTFRELYYDVIKEILVEYPDAKFDDVLWYLKESFQGTYFWEDWTKKLFEDVQFDLVIDKEETKQTEMADN